MARAIAVVVLCGIAVAARPARADLRAPPRLVLRLATSDEPAVVVPGDANVAPRPSPRPSVEAPRPAPVDPDATLAARQVGMGFVAVLGASALASGLLGLDTCATGVVIGGILGLTIGTLVGAYNGWRIFKRPKPSTLPAALL